MTDPTTTTLATTDPPAKPLTVAVIGAGGKMGMRVSNNLAKSAHTVFYSEASPAGQERTRDAGREITSTGDAIVDADVVILAVPDVVLGAVSETVVPQMKSGAIILTLDPAAAYAGLLQKRDDIEYAVAHPCHPSLFLERRTDEEYADTFGGIAAPQEVVAAIEPGSAERTVDAATQAVAESVISTIYAPVIAVHWVTVKQLAVLEPTLVETIACMIGALLKEALDETVNTVGVPAEAARAMLWGHASIAMTNALRGSNPFSDACLIAMDYGKKTIIKDDWKKIFDDSELDGIIAKMLKIDAVRR